MSATNSRQLFAFNDYYVDDIGCPTSQGLGLGCDDSLAEVAGTGPRKSGVLAVIREYDELASCRPDDLIPIEGHGHALPAEAAEECWRVGIERAKKHVSSDTPLKEGDIDFSLAEEIHEELWGDD